MKQSANMNKRNFNTHHDIVFKTCVWKCYNKLYNKRINLDLNNKT